MARNSNRPTGHAPPESFIDIHVVNENQPMLATMIRLTLSSQTYDGRSPRINAPGLIPAPVKGTKHQVAVAIIAFDEFTDIPGTLLQLSQVYADSTVLVAYIEFDNEKIKDRLRNSRIKDTVQGYDFKVLTDLVEQIARRLKKRGNSKRPPTT